MRKVGSQTSGTGLKTAMERTDVEKDGEKQPRARCFVHSKYLSQPSDFSVECKTKTLPVDALLHPSARNPDLKHQDGQSNYPSFPPDHRVCWGYVIMYV